MWKTTPFTVGEATPDSMGFLGAECKQQALPDGGTQSLVPLAVAVSPGLVGELRVLVPIPGRVEDLGVGTFTSGMLLPHWHHPSVSSVKSSSVRTT